MMIKRSKYDLWGVKISSARGQNMIIKVSNYNIGGSKYDHQGVIMRGSKYHQGVKKSSSICSTGLAST
eukprot:8643633-Karenia_brevis.AAC.1